MSLQNTATLVFLTLCISHVSYGDARHGPIRPLINPHTSLSSSSGTVDVSGSYSGSYPGWNAVAPNSNMWISSLNVSPAWIAYAFTGGPRRVVGYRIEFGNGALTGRAPRTFEFQVFEGSVWKTIDERCCERDWATYEERSYYLSQPVTGEKFRLYITKDNHDSAANDIVVVSMRRFQIL